MTALGFSLWFHRDLGRRATLAFEARDRRGFVRVAKLSLKSHRRIKRMIARLGSEAEEVAARTHFEFGGILECSARP